MKRYTITLSTGKTVCYRICPDVNDGSQEQLEFYNMDSLTIQDKRKCTAEYADMCRHNSDHESKHFVVAEYIGSECASSNWEPDIQEDGLTEGEIDELLAILDNKSDLH